MLAITFGQSVSRIAGTGKKFVEGRGYGGDRKAKLLKQGGKGRAITSLRKAGGGISRATTRYPAHGETLQNGISSGLASE
jgi:hypothetical protein